MTQQEYLKSDINPFKKLIGQKRPDAFFKIAGNKHPMKNPEIVKRMIETKRRTGGFEKVRLRQLTDNTAKYCKSPSIPQLAVFKHFQQLFDFVNVYCNYHVKKAEGRGGYYYLDVAIPIFRLDIEYDNPYWHKIHQKDDSIRDKTLREMGWNIIRINKQFTYMDKIKYLGGCLKL